MVKLAARVDEASEVADSGKQQMDFAGEPAMGAGDRLPA